MDNGPDQNDVQGAVPTRECTANHRDLDVSPAHPPQGEWADENHKGDERSKKRKAQSSEATGLG
jgi:hypothetical protein